MEEISILSSFQLCPHPLHSFIYYFTFFKISSFFNRDGKPKFTLTLSHKEFWPSKREGLTLGNYTDLVVLAVCVIIASQHYPSSILYILGSD